MLLFLDDSMDRTNRFLSKNPEAVCVATAAQCIDVLDEYCLAGGMIALHLDHDLGGETFVNSDREDCGMEVVRYIIANLAPDCFTSSVIIHSWNIPAAKRMMHCLWDSGFNATCRPFGM